MSIPLSGGTAIQQHGEKLVAIQALRFVAAMGVAVVHQAFAFATYMGSGLGIPAPGWPIGQIAVSLFFVISGYIMVISSRRLFGRPGAMRIFLTRRFARILPSYWIASLLLVAVLLGLRG
ncbi:MAG: acyltransferase family protein, partial [Alteraurantiacibacter sp.]